MTRLTTCFACLLPSSLITLRAVKTLTTMLTALFQQTPFPGPYIEPENFDLDEIWSFLQSNEEEMRNGLTKELFSERARQNLTMVYKVQVTPTRILLTGPEPEAKNRILRKVSNR